MALQAGAARRDHAAHEGGTLGPLLAVCVAPFVALLSVFALSPFLPVISRELDTPVPVLGQIPALTMLLAAALGLVVGPLADRFGQRATLTLGMLASAAGALGTGLAPGFATLIAAALFAGISRSIGQPVSQAAAGTRFTGDDRRRVMGYVQAAGAVSPILGVPLLTAIGGEAGWRPAFFALAVLSLAAALLVWRLLPPDTRPAAAPATGTPRPGRRWLAPYAPLLTRAPTMGLYGGTLFRNVGTRAFMTYFGAFLVQRYDLTTQQVGLLFTATGIGNVAGSMATGGRLGRLSLRALAAGTNGLHLLLVAVIFLLAPPLPLAIPLILLAFVSNGCVAVCANTLLTGETPAGAGRSTAMSLNQTCMSMGGALGSSLGGLLLATGGYAAVSWLLFACAALSTASVSLGARGHRQS